MIGGQEIGEIIPYPVLIIPFPVSKLVMNSLVKFRNSLQKTFLIRGQKVGEIIPFPVWIIPFPVFKTSFGVIVKT